MPPIFEEADNTLLEEFHCTKPAATSEPEKQEHYWKEAT